MNTLPCLLSDFDVVIQLEITILRHYDNDGITSHYVASGKVSPVVYCVYRSTYNPRIKHVTLSDMYRIRHQYI